MKIEDQLNEKRVLGKKTVSLLKFQERKAGLDTIRFCHIQQRHCIVGSENIFELSTHQGRSRRRTQCPLSGLSGADHMGPRLSAVEADHQLAGSDFRSLVKLCRGAPARARPGPAESRVAGRPAGRSRPRDTQLAP